METKVIEIEELEKRTDERIKDALTLEVKNLCDELKEIKHKLNSKNTDCDSTELIQLKSRLEDLELWRGKIHSLLISSTPTGKEKLSNIGRFKAMGYLQKEK